MYVVEPSGCESPAYLFQLGGFMSGSHGGFKHTPPLAAVYLSSRANAVRMHWTQFPSVCYSVS